MSEDIVKYLRLSRTQFNRHAEAADEIERLQADVYRWRRIADVCAIAIGIPENDTDRLAVELYDKAVRGE